MHEFIQSIFTFLIDLGYIGIALALMIEVIPSEIVLAYAGYLVSRGEVSFVGAVIAGTIGGTIAQLFLYWMGLYGGRPFLDKYGKYLLIKKAHLDLSEEWFRKYGPGVIFTARFIPVVRHAISIPAGIANMSATRFTIYTIGAIIPWSIFFIFLGEKLGSNWQKIDEIAQPYLRPVAFGALIVMALYIVVQLYRRRKNNG
ncbi:membrane protein DedA with SNARE-associated domain [Anoxybacillus voinovskiensis]|uniref:Membrane protein DedA with SNARE-associated domain n=1 Tax=Anoxybacteroides voinovskiense TaxID=230470 RepID=A0A840DQ22_9BACL|nr:DedA family protein [Anoxybacillus voinovskiensis]MBB4073622.1 membrane protein DedA with SNARE-associated domain [Anoxybacillus voinovskiensis]GGJ63308.1 alkaline phosphatase [Anoxybacillus voinovskiensis]